MIWDCRQPAWIKEVRLIEILQLAYATMTSPEVESQSSYYSDVLGLSLVASGASDVVFVNQVGQHALVLERGPSASLKGLTFQVAPDSDLAAIATVLEGHGVACQMRTDPAAGIARSLVFQDPDGTVVQLAPQLESFGLQPRNGGIGPVRLGHVARLTSNLRKQLDFYQTLLGFRVSDWRADETAYFLRCGPDHHTVNFFSAGQSQLHHLAFELKDWAEMGRACDSLAAHGLRLDWGPSRHVIGHNIACYHSNGDGIRIELFTEMDRMTNEELGYFDPRPWHEDQPQRPRAWGSEFGKSAWGP